MQPILVFCPLYYYFFSSIQFLFNMLLALTVLLAWWCVAEGGHCRGAMSILSLLLGGRPPVRWPACYCRAGVGACLDLTGLHADPTRVHPNLTWTWVGYPPPPHAWLGPTQLIVIGELLGVCSPHRPLTYTFYDWVKDDMPAAPQQLANLSTGFWQIYICTSPPPSSWAEREFGLPLHWGGVPV